ncbi:MAG: hypothetical protein ACLP59_10070 [Bryobacteraceae bacterium]
MVKHNIRVQGVDLQGVTHHRPALLQMNDNDFPNAFLRDLSAMNQLELRRKVLSSAKHLPASANSAVTLYQPVTRVVHLAMVQLACESPGYPRLDPARVVSAGLVIRRVPNAGGTPPETWPWMSNSKGQFAWVKPLDLSMADEDPDPAKRPLLQSGQAALDQMLATQTLGSALTESTTPAFVASPVVCNAVNRTLVYAVIPTASSEASTVPPVTPAPPIDPHTLHKLLPTLLKRGKHSAPYPNQCVTYKFMSDDYAKANKASDFTIFSAALRMLYSSFGAFDDAQGAVLLDALNQYYVTVETDYGDVRVPMGDFYSDAANKLIVYDSNTDPAPAPEVKMPCAWDAFSHEDEAKLFAIMAPLLQSRGAASSVPEGRFQDSSRLYRARLFFRIKGEHASCPPELVWSDYSHPFRIAAWYEGSGRVVAPVPMPDIFDKNTLQSAKKASSFSVPHSLMNAMGGASLTGLSNGTPPPPGGGGVGITWICSFSIPLITICAFFVLNIFISLLNIVFFWMAFIKICIPIPVPKSNPNN